MHTIEDCHKWASEGQKKYINEYNAKGDWYEKGHSIHNVAKINRSKKKKPLC